MARRKGKLESYLVGAFSGVIVLGIGGWLWWSSHEFGLSGEHWMTKASDDARAWADDAELVMIEGKYVRPDGVVELGDTISGRWHFLFRSPSQASARSEAEPQSVVPGAPVPARTSPYDCFSFSVSRGSGRSHNLVLDSGGPVTCRSGLGPAMAKPPQCTVEQVWARAKQQGAPDPGYAAITARVEDGAWRWSFQIEGHVELELADDC